MDDLDSLERALIIKYIYFLVQNKLDFKIFTYHELQNTKCLVVPLICSGNFLTIHLNVVCIMNLQLILTMSINTNEVL